MRRSLGLVGVAAAVALVGASAQAAAPARTWHSEVRVTSSAHLMAGALAANGDALTSGTIYVAGRPRVEVATRSGFAGGWSVRQLTGALNGGTPTVSAINDADAAVVLWRAPGRSVYSSVRATRTGVWRTLVVPSGAVAHSSGPGFLTPSAAMNAKGQATVAWAAHEQHGWAVRSAFRSGTNAIWRATPALFLTTPAGSGLAATIAVRTNAAGDAIAAWSTQNASTVYVALRSAHKAWGPPTAIGTMAWTGSAAGTPPSVSIAPNGRVALAWAFSATSGPGFTQSQVALATGSALTGHVSTPTTIATGIAPSIAINSAGALAAAWGVAVDPGFYTVTQDAAVAADGTTWTAPQVLDTVGSGSEFYFGNVALAESGRAFAYWSVHVGPGVRTAAVESAGADGVWTGFSKDGEVGPTLALNRPGDALALTSAYDPPIPQTIANSYDAALRVTHAQWVWLHGVYIPAHFAKAQRAAVWARLTANPSAALALVRRYAPASIR